MEDVYVVTNNHFEGKAVANAAMLQSMIEGRRVDAPPDLAARYGDALAPFVNAQIGLPLAPSSTGGPEGRRRR